MYLCRSSFASGGRTGGASSAWKWSRTASTSWPPGISRSSRFSTHMDTVPPFYRVARRRRMDLGPRRVRHQGHHRVHDLRRRGAAGRRACAASRCCSWSARSATAPVPLAARETAAAAASSSMASRPKTSSRWDRKGALRFEIVARGRMAHSAYPHLGESAIEKLLDALERVRRIPLPDDPCWARARSTSAPFSGGRAPNVIPDHASAEIFIRLVDSGDAFARGDRGSGCGSGRGARGAVHSCAAFGRAGRDSRPRWSPTPPTFPPSAARGASRF